MNTIKNWLLGLFLAAGLALSVVGALSRCSPADGAGNGAKVESVLVIRHDTLMTIDTLRKTRIKYIDTSKITVVHDTLDAIIAPDSSDGNEVIASNQLREAVKWKDSLNTCIDMRKVDSVALDTLGKLAKQVPDTIKESPSVIDRLKDFGAGLLVGAGLRSFF